MIANLEFSTLEPNIKVSVADTDRQTAAPAGDTEHFRSPAESQMPGAPGVRSARPVLQPDLPSDDPVIMRAIKPHRHITPPVTPARDHRASCNEPEIVTAAKKLLAKEILELLGSDLRDPVAHARWLMTLSLDVLKARRDQIKSENQREFKL